MNSLLAQANRDEDEFHVNRLSLMTLPKVGLSSGFEKSHFTVSLRIVNSNLSESVSISNDSEDLLLHNSNTFE